MSKSTKVAIIGAGAVGTATANSILTRGLASEIVLIDINKSKALGEVLDMQHSMEYQVRNTILKAGEYSDCSDADIVIITVAAPFDGVLDRLLFRDKTAKILDSVVPEVIKSGFDGIFIVVSNPVDVMTQYVKELSGFDKSKVIGTGTILESSRLKFILGNMLNVNAKSIDAYVLGEHGDSMVIPWSHIRLASKPFLEVVNDNKDIYGEVNLDEIYNKTKNAGHEVMKAKGNTMYGIASGVNAIVTAILLNEYRTLPVSAYLDGEYGLSDVYCGVPAVICQDGIVDVGEYNLSPEEKDEFLRSAKLIKESFDGIKR